MVSSSVYVAGAGSFALSPSASIAGAFPFPFGFLFCGLSSTSVSDNTSFDLGPVFFGLFAFGAGACGLIGRLPGFGPATGRFDCWTRGAGCPTAGVAPEPDAAAGGAGTGSGAGTVVGTGSGAGTGTGAGIWTVGGAGAEVEEPAVDGTVAWTGTGGEEGAGVRDGTGAGASGVSKYRRLNGVNTYLAPASSCREDVSYKGPHSSLPYPTPAPPTNRRWNSNSKLGTTLPQPKEAGRGYGWHPGHGYSMPCSKNKCESRDESECVRTHHFATDELAQPHLLLLRVGVRDLGQDDVDPRHGGKDLLGGRGSGRRRRRRRVGRHCSR
jgi:hypothetical protein